MGVLCLVTWFVALRDPQLSISQKALGTLPEDGNVKPKHVMCDYDYTSTHSAEEKKAWR
jgi:hypothetical protein